MLSPLFFVPEESLEVSKRSFSVRCYLCWLVGLFLISVVANCQHSKAADIAIYSDRGVWDESVMAAEKMFQWMGYTVSLVDADYINREGLSNFRMVCVPGGDMYQYAQDLSSIGKENIRSFVREGGSYIGICGGAYFAASRVVWQGEHLQMIPLNLFHGTAEGPYDAIIPYPDYGMCEIRIVNSLHPITESLPDTLWILYYWGPALLPSDTTNLTVLGRYDVVNHSAIMSLEYGHGRVFLIGTHPEIEEDSERDGVEFADELDDKGSDWELMKKAVLWSLGTQ